MFHVARHSLQLPEQKEGLFLSEVFGSNTLLTKEWSGTGRLSSSLVVAWSSLAPGSPTCGPPEVWLGGVPEPLSGSPSCGPPDVWS